MNNTNISWDIGYLLWVDDNEVYSDDDLSPDLHQATIWTNAEILLTGPLRTKLSEILIHIYTFSFKKMHLKMSFGCKMQS